MFIFIFKILYQTPLVSFLTYNLLCSLKQNYLEQHHLTPLLIRGGGKKNNKRTNKQKISSLTLFNISPVSVMSLSQRRSLVGLKFPFHCTCAFEMERGFLRPSLTSWFQKLTVWNCDSFSGNLLGNYLSSKTLQSSSWCSENRCKTGGTLLLLNSFCLLHVYMSLWEVIVIFFF